MATVYTPNYNLDLYASEDKPNLRDQYNGAMGKIDAQLKTFAGDITNANATVLTMQSQVNTNKDNVAAVTSTVETHSTQIADAAKEANDALTLAQTNEADIASAESDITALTSRMTANETLAKSNKSRLDTAEASISQNYTNINSAQSDIDRLTNALNASPENVVLSYATGVDSTQVSVWERNGLVTVNVKNFTTVSQQRNNLATIKNGYRPTADLTAPVTFLGDGGNAFIGLIKITTSGELYINACNNGIGEQAFASFCYWTDHTIF